MLLSTRRKTCIESTQISPDVFLIDSQGLKRQSGLYPTNWTTAILIVALLVSSSLATAGTPSTILSTQTLSPFYQQLRTDVNTLYPRNNNSLLSQVIPYSNYSNSPVANPEHEDDLAFNYLWMQQHQQGYSHTRGGAAAGKILRMGAKALYRSYYGLSNTSGVNSEEDFSAVISKFDYRLRLSGDKVKVGVKYEF